MTRCTSSLRLPTGNRVPCTRDHDHLETHALLVFGQLLLTWGMNDAGKGEVTGGSLAPLFPDGVWPHVKGEDGHWPGVQRD